MVHRRRAALFLPLGLVILGSAVLPRILGYLALVLAAGYALAGSVTLLDLTVPAAVQISAGVVPALWWLAAAGTLIMRARQAPSTAGLFSGVAAAGHGTAGFGDQCSVASASSGQAQLCHPRRP